MECPNCSFQNMPGLKRCGRCSSLLDLSNVDFVPPRSARSKQSRAISTAIGRELLATGRDVDRVGRGLRRALAGLGATPPDWTSVGLSILPGLGQWHLGQRAIGIALLATWLLLLLGIGLTVASTTAWLLLLLAIGLHTFALSLLFARSLHEVGVLRRMGVGLLLWAAVNAVVYLPAYWLTSRCATFVLVQGVNANPLIENGDVLLVPGPWVRSERWRVGDLVLFDVAPESGSGFRIAGGQTVDRIIALAGDVVELKDGTIRVNGVALPKERGPINGTALLPATLRVQVRPDCVLLVPSTLQVRGNAAQFRGGAGLLVGNAIMVNVDRVHGRVVWRVRPWTRFGRIDPLADGDAAASGRAAPATTPTPRSAP